MCADCVGNYYKKDTFECEECPPDVQNIIVLILYVAALIIICVLLVQAQMKGSQLRKPLYSVYLKIFLNHFQLLQVIATIQFGWPFEIAAILNF